MGDRAGHPDVHRLGCQLLAPVLGRGPRLIQGRLPDPDPRRPGQVAPAVHEIDEARTRQAVTRLRDALGDLIPVNVDRGPAFVMWRGDLSTDLGYLRGIENFMLDMHDRPAWLQSLVGFMADGVLRTHEQAETAATGGSATTRTRPCPMPRNCPTPRPTPRGSGDGSSGPLPRPRSSPSSRQPCTRSSSCATNSHIEGVRAGRLRLLRGPHPQDRHAAPDPEPAPHRGRPCANVARCAEQIGPTTCSATAPARRTWSVTAGIRSLFAGCCGAISRPAAVATSTSRSKTSRPCRATPTGPALGGIDARSHRRSLCRIGGGYLIQLPEMLPSDAVHTPILRGKRRPHTARG